MDILRESRRCRRKKKFNNYLLAFQAFVDFGDCEVPMSIYWCVVCGGLHLGRRVLSPDKEKNLYKMSRSIIGKLLCKV
jgi:hypothetical protein